MSCRRHSRRWNEAELDILRSRYGTTPPALIAEELGRTVAAIWQCALRLKLQHTGFYRTPSVAQYHTMLRAECLQSGVCYRDALTKTKTPNLSGARWRVYKRLHNEGYSISGIASAANRDRSSVGYAIKALAQCQ